MATHGFLVGKHILAQNRAKRSLIYSFGLFSDFQWVEQERKEGGRKKSCRTSTGKTSETGTGWQPGPCRCSSHMKGVPGLGRIAADLGSAFLSSQEMQCHNVHLQVTRSSCCSAWAYCRGFGLNFSFFPRNVVSQLAPASHTCKLLLGLGPRRLCLYFWKL